MTMKEACAKTIENRKAQFEEHRALHRGVTMQYVDSHKLSGNNNKPV